MPLTVLETKGHPLTLIAAPAGFGKTTLVHLVISVSTVKTHINHIFGKLSVVNRTQATARARALGLLAD